MKDTKKIQKTLIVQDLTDKMRPNLYTFIRTEEEFYEVKIIEIIMVRVPSMEYHKLENPNTYNFCEFGQVLKEYEEHIPLSEIKNLIPEKFL